jgi:hypothetical protein
MDGRGGEIVPDTRGRGGEIAPDSRVSDGSGESR